MSRTYAGCYARSDGPYLYLGLGIITTKLVPFNIQFINNNGKIEREESFSMHRCSCAALDC